MSEVADLVSLSAAVAAREWRLVRNKMAEVHQERGEDPAAEIAVEEALLQCYLFLGFPAALEAFMIWRDVAGESRSGMERNPGADTLEEWRRRGQTICKTVYQASFEKLRANVRRLHPELDRWMITEGYGKVLGRPGLSLAVRELCNVAILSATGWERQLRSHLHGALNAGASPGEIDDALESGLRLVSDPDWRPRAKALWAQIRGRPGAATG
ncbi:MAG: carboxymuconolactone decarboxylase family protein [Gemmatimonadota bacterium]